jgi:hypothetical protein
MDNSMNNFYSMSLATLVGVTHITTSNTTIIKTDTVYFTDPIEIHYEITEEIFIFRFGEQPF